MADRSEEGGWGGLRWALAAAVLAVAVWIGTYIDVRHAEEDFHKGPSGTSSNTSITLNYRNRYPPWLGNRLSSLHSPLAQAEYLWNRNFFVFTVTEDLSPTYAAPTTPADPTAFPVLPE